MPQGPFKLLRSRPLTAPPFFPEPDLDFFELKRVLRTLLLPPAGPLLMALIGVLLLRRWPRAGARMALAGIVFAWLLSTPVMADFLVGHLERDQRPLDAAKLASVRAGPNPPRAVVILGGGALRDGDFSPGREHLHGRTLERVMAGAQVARISGLPVLVTGGRPPWLKHSEAELMRRVLESELSRKVRWLEDDSRDTEENARFSARLLKKDGIDSIILVTHAYHMPRAVKSFEAAGLKVLAAPHDWKGAQPAWLDPSDWVPSALDVETVWLSTHELLGDVWYRLRGYF